MPKMLKEGRPLRQSEHINRRVTQSVFRAFDYALEIGSPLNLYVVINLHETMKVSAAAIFKAIRHKYRDWLNYRTKKAQSAPSCDFGQVGERFGNVAFGIDDGNHRRGQFAPS